ncbi:WhiB family transcriptional regulator [Streptomyces sp. NPDC050504]|uniref:WhiB family transcriptional regulator n=1 Tax=Streptomyces sp. NPDC050504 TaxID=3365618 RepID=UPI003799D098
MEWLRSAACVRVDPELFFPVGTSGPALRDTRAAKAVCARCPVAEQCLSWALDTGQATGVWGGTCPEERALLRRAQSRAAASGGRRAVP